MVIENKYIYMGRTEEGEEICVLPAMANRHGLIAGATGSGKTVTLKVMAEAFSRMGVPVFVSDVKGDLSGMSAAGVENEALRHRVEELGLLDYGFQYDQFPTVYWDIFGKKGIQLRTTISEMGPLLLSRIMGLNDLQSDILTIVFKIADDENLLLIDTKDLKAMLDHVSKHNKEYEAEYGKMSTQSIAAIVRGVVALEMAGGDVFFGEPALSVLDWLSTDPSGKGMIHVLDSSSLINNGKLYSTFLLWLLSELFEILPEVGDAMKPKMVFFFDEAHLLFKDAPKSLIEKVEQVVKLIRSKGVGIYFITQNPRDIPDGVLSQLGNKIEHALHAYTPADQKAVKAAAESYPVNPAFSTYDAILSLGTGEAVVSFLLENGTPMQAQKVKIVPPQSFMGEIEPGLRQQIIQSSLLYSKYANATDPDSAYEFLQRMGLEEQKAREEAIKQAQEEKEAEKRKKEEEKEAARKQKEEEREAAKKAAATKRSVKAVGNTVAGTVGREVGKQMGSSFGKFGKTLGGNVGASLGRGLLSTFLK